LKMCYDTADAMAYLHSFEPAIIHRDLKSLNVLLESPILCEGDRPVAKVTDFGLSRLKASTSHSTMTVEVGTVHWMAPEIASEKYDEKVDLYSYAMVLYELIYRAIPFGDWVDDRQIAACVEAGERPDVDVCPADCPGVLISLMKMCWDHVPAKRPTFDQVRKAVAVALEAAVVSSKMSL